MQKTLTLDDQNIDDFILSDAQLTGINWEAEGHDLSLNLSLADNHSAKLVCTWANGVRIDLNFADDHCGYSLSWESKYKREGKQWKVALEFPPQGIIELVCNEVCLIYEA